MLAGFSLFRRLKSLRRILAEGIILPEMIVPIEYLDDYERFYSESSNIDDDLIKGLAQFWLLHGWRPCLDARSRFKERASGQKKAKRSGSLILPPYPMLAYAVHEVSDWLVITVITRHF